jgi:hypothetical protein
MVVTISAVITIPTVVTVASVTVSQRHDDTTTQQGGQERKDEKPFHGYYSADHYSIYSKQADALWGICNS